LLLIGLRRGKNSHENCHRARHYTKELVKSTEQTGSPLATIGFVLFCTFLLSGFANEWSLRLFGMKAYISTATLILLPVVWLLSGGALRGLRTGIGLWWAAFLGWLILATPFSVWRGGSATLLWNYAPRAYLCFFFTCSFVTSLRRCRQLMCVNIAGAAILLATCAAFGGVGDDPGEFRFRIPQSLFYANANDLALALLLGMTCFLFLFWRSGIAARLLAAAGILLCALYLVRTGSRGGFLAGLVLLGAVLVLNRNKARVALVALPMAALVLAASPGESWHRLSLLMAEPGASTDESSSDSSSVNSQEERQAVLRRSILYTVRHPLFGVGPDQFAVAVGQEAQETGHHEAWLGTHNAFTQVSSECGIPALICYVAVIGLCLRTNLHLYRRSRDVSTLRDVAAISLCLFAGTLVYATSAFFFHFAYSAHLPLLAGATAAMDLTTRRTNSVVTITA